MAALPLHITDEGLAAIAGASGSDPARILEVGLSDTPFDLAPTLTDLPGEFKRITAVAGEQVAPNITHMTAYDNSDEVWEATGFGLFLEDGTLFAAYSSDAAIMAKAAPAFALFALDIIFNADLAELIDFGDPAFTVPPATEEVRGIAEIATQEEVDAGEDDERFITPFKLKTFLAGLSDGLGDLAGTLAGLLSRTITGTGLASGGGNLTADREINVPAASQAETEAGIVNTKAVTPAGLSGIIATVSGLVTDMAARALKTITITGNGLASGGGNLTANRVITVTECSAADITAGLAADKVVTPRRLGPISMLLATNGFIRFFGLQLAWGRFTSSPNALTSVSFALAFQTDCFAVVANGTNDSNTNSQDNWPAVKGGTITRFGFSVFSANDSSDICSYIAVGY